MTNLEALRVSFAALAHTKKLKAMARATIGKALAATPADGGPQQSQSERPSAPLPPVAFNVAVSFKSRDATLRLGLCMGLRPRQRLLACLLTQPCIRHHNTANTGGHGHQKVLSQPAHHDG